MGDFHGFDDVFDAVCEMYGDLWDDGNNTICYPFKLEIFKFYFVPKLIFYNVIINILKA